MKILFLFLCLFSKILLAEGQFNIFIKGIQNLPSSYSRDVYVYLPNGYEKTNRRYPVLYMHDGQNLFDPTRAYNGQTWDALNTLNRLIARKMIEPVIVVAIDNTPDRMDEYIPENKGEDYLNFIINKIKPQIDIALRTKPGPAHTAILGSSLGGLISFSAGLKHSEVFGIVGGLSPSIWWNNRSIIEAFNQSKHYPQKIYMDSGTIGGEMPQDVIDLSDLLLDRGFHHGQNMFVLIQTGAEHQEYYWSQRFPVALRFLFPY